LHVVIDASFLAIRDCYRSDASITGAGVQAKGHKEMANSLDDAKVAPNGHSGVVGGLRMARKANAESEDTGVKIVHVVRGTFAATSRGSLELLNLPYPFSQAGLLDAGDFLKLASQRRIKMSGARDLDLAGLQELHQHQILVPLFCVRLGDKDRSKKVDTTSNLTKLNIRATLVNQLYVAASEGRLTDPSTEPFEPWPTNRVRSLWPSVERGYLYSEHQLLGLQQARGLVGFLYPTERNDGRFIYHLQDSNLPDEQTKKALASWRSLAITLSAIDSRYWPYITQVILGDANIWRSTNLSQTAEQLLDWLGVSKKDIANEASRLHADASFEDDLGDFYELVRQAKPKSWLSLRGSTRTALDSRMAAEVLNKFAGDIPEIDEEEKPPLESLSMQGLSARPRSLDAVLTDLQLSPHPPLVVALEGETEMRTVPRVMRLLGIPDDPTKIRFVNFGGVGRDLALLARFAAEPVLGADHGNFVRLDRPITRFLVLTDAEEKYKTAENRKYQKNLLIKSIAAELPNDLRGDLLLRSSRIVEIMTWGKFPWEFAHFTDAQLADAILSATAKTPPNGRVGLVQAIHAERVSSSPNIRDAWNRSGVSKPDLADALWTKLEERIERAISHGARRPPVMKAALRAYELAYLTHGLNMALKRRGRPTRK